MTRRFLIAKITVSLALTTSVARTIQAANTEPCNVARLLSEVHLRPAVSDALTSEIIRNNPHLPKEALINELKEPLERVTRALDEHHQVQSYVRSTERLETTFSAGPKELTIQHGNERTSVWTKGYDLVETRDRDYRPYFVREPRAFKDAPEAAKDLEAAAIRVQEKTERLKQTYKAFGWGKSFSPSMHQYALVPGSGLLQTIERPEMVISFFRGFKASSLYEAIAFAEKGLTPHGYSPQQLETDIRKFVSSNIDQREIALGREEFARMDAAKSFLIGGSTSRLRAKGWGNFVFECEIPKEAHITRSLGGPFAGEGESFVAFKVHPEWIKQITDPDGNVLWRRTAKPRITPPTSAFQHLDAGKDFQLSFGVRPADGILQISVIDDPKVFRVTRQAPHENVLHGLDPKVNGNSVTLTDREIKKAGTQEITVKQNQTAIDLNEPTTISFFYHGSPLGEYIRLPDERVLRISEPVSLSEADFKFFRTLSEQYAATWKSKQVPAFKRITNPSESRLMERGAASLHDDWRAPRWKPELKRYEARWKKTPKEEWETLKSRYPEARDAFRTTKDQGTELYETDIANLRFAQLPNQYQFDNAETARVVSALILDAANTGNPMNEEFVELASSVVHSKWLERNGAWAEEAQKSPYRLLPEDQKELDRKTVRMGIKMYLSGL